MAHVAVEKYKSQKSYELGTYVGEKITVYGDVIPEEKLVKVTSQRSHQVGYLPKDIIYQLEDL